MGPYTKNIAQIILFNKYEYILKIWSLYDHRQKKIAILTILGALKDWGAESKFWSNIIFGHGKVSIYNNEWAFENHS